MSKPHTSSKLFYRLDEVSRLTKVEAATIEAWEKEFPFLQPGLTGSGQKIFRAKDVEIITRIKELLDGKNVTLAGAKRRIEEELGLRSAAPIHPDRMRKTLLFIREELQEISAGLGAKPKKS
ncbi:MAG: MerR family transcriptional regulator [Acidobacteriota bacterium]|nr:MerR family transcriptional regulator [Acidobacteriota bacterium]